MGRAGVLQGVRQMRFEGLLERHERGEPSRRSSEMLGMSERRGATGSATKVPRACAIGGSAGRRGRSRRSCARWGYMRSATEALR